MKRYIAIFVVIIICFSVMLSACNTTPHSSDGTENTDPPKEKITIPAISKKEAFYFKSYDELKAALQKSDAELSELIRKEQNDYGEIYKATMDAFENGSISVLAPCRNGYPMGLEPRLGYAKTFITTSELYRLPWIWYRCQYDNYNIIVKVSHISVIDDAKIDDVQTYLDFLSILPFDAPTPDNYHEYPNYSNIYEKEIKLMDRTVTALVHELTDGSKKVMFYIDGALVVMTGEEKALSDSFFSKFSLRAI